MLLKNKFYTEFSAYCGLIMPRLWPFSGISDTILMNRKQPSNYTLNVEFKPAWQLFL